jgi:hypothetical protein
MRTYRPDSLFGASMAIASALLGSLTILRGAWTESITGYKPDHHDRVVEVFADAMLLAASVCDRLLARATKRHIAWVSGRS